MSMPVMTEAFFFVQDIDSHKENPEFNLMQNLNFGLQITSLFLSSYLFSVIFIFILKYMKRVIDKKTIAKPKCALKQIVSSCLNITDQVYNTSSSMSVFILILELYLWLFMLMVANTIKTDKVVIDTSKIIKNVDDALSTERTLCLIEGDTELKVCCSKNTLF